MQRFYRPWYLGEPFAAAWGKSAQSRAVCRRGPARLEDRLPVILAQGPILAISAFGASGLEPHTVANQIPEDKLIQSTSLPPHTLFVPMNHHDDYPYPPIAVTPMFRGVRVEEFFVLNLCCGHRRAGDIEDLSKEVAAFLPFKLWVISIDIVSGNDAHDLMNATSVRRIRENIKSGRIHFWVIGIPCKTWTAVRFRELLTLLGQKGPRPFRSAEEPRALRHLTKREYRQLYVGNTLLQTTGSLVADSLEAGVGGIVEHLDEPSQKAYPSIWRLPVFRRVAAHPQARVVSFEQGPLGQSSTKPTRFLAIGCGHIKQYIDMLSSSSFRPGGLTSIVDSNGGFSTSKLKTYPPRLNGAIILAFLHAALASRIDDCSDEFPRVMFSVVDAVLARCNSISDANLVLADHQPTLAESHPIHTFMQCPDRQAGRGPDLLECTHISVCRNVGLGTSSPKDVKYKRTK